MCSLQKHFIFVWTGRNAMCLQNYKIFPGRGELGYSCNYESLLLSKLQSFPLLSWASITVIVADCSTMIKQIGRLQWWKPGTPALSYWNNLRKCRAYDYRYLTAEYNYRTSALYTSLPSSQWPHQTRCFYQYRRSVFRRKRTCIVSRKGAALLDNTQYYVWTK